LLDFQFLNFGEVGTWWIQKLIHVYHEENFNSKENEG